MGELTELAYLSLQETKLTLIGFVACGSDENFLSYPLVKPDALQDWDFEAILIRDLGYVKTTKSMLQDSGVARDKAFSIV